MKKSVFKFIALFLLAIICFHYPAVVQADSTPFFCGPVCSSANVLDEEYLFSKWFDQQDFLYRTDIEAIDYYTSTERTVCIYDDGNDSLFTSDSGYYFGHIANNSTARLYAFLQTEYGIENSRYGDMSVSTYKTTDGYWILGNLGDYTNGLFYIDLANEKCYYKKIYGLRCKLCTSDRFLMLFDDNGFTVIDRDQCAIQLIDLKGIDIVPYFDAEGIATIIINPKYYSNDQDYRRDFYINNDYYYYSWDTGNVYPITYKDYDYVCYADSKSIIVESEFSFKLIENNEEVWDIGKKDIVNNTMAMYSIQNGVLWQYGNGSNYYHTYLVPSRQTLMGYAFGEPSEKVDLAYTVGWSGRYSDCHNYDLTDHSIDHKSVFDQLTMQVFSLSKYHRSSRIYNQNQVIWDRNLINDMGGDYGIYNFVDGSYNQRSIVLSDESITELSNDSGAQSTNPDSTLQAVSNTDIEKQVVIEGSNDAGSNDQASSSSLEINGKEVEHSEIGKTMPVSTPTYIPGENNRLYSPVFDVSGTSYIHSSNGSDYSPAQMTDGDETTAWQASLKDNKLGDIYAYFSFDTPIKVSELWIKNGFWKITNGYDQYTRNSRVKKLGIAFKYNGDDDFTDKISLIIKDDKKRQDWQKFELGEHDNVIEIRFRILEIYKGSKFPKDVCISEVVFVE